MYTGIKGLWLGLLVCPLLAQPLPSRGVNFYTLEREIRLGREAAYNLEHTLPVVHAARLEGYLTKIGGLLVEKDPDGKPVLFQFTIFDDRKPFTAYPGELAMPADALGAGEPVALPGGFIFVPLQLISGAPDEASLAFQLAHAMAHVTRRHGSRRATREELAGLASLEVAIHTAAVQVGFSTHGLVGRLGGLQYARTCELEADRAAAGMMVGAGFDPESFVRYLESLPPGPQSPAFSAHPSVEKRIAAIEELRPQLPYSTATGDFASIKALAAAIP